MTVANENSVIQYTLTSGTQNLPTNFYFLEASHLTVTKTVSGVDSVLVLNSDYSVNLPVVDAGNGSIDIITGTIGDVVTIENCPPGTQATDYVESDRFPADVTEKGLDKLTMLYNKLKSSIFGQGSISSRFLQYPSTELSTPAVTPNLSDRQAGGNGTLAAFKGSDGAIDAISKGSVGVSLTLSNDSALGGGSPDAVNGVTQAAVKTYADAIQTELDDTQVGVGGLSASGNYISKSGTNYIDGNSDLNEDITDLDAQAKTNADNIATNTGSISAIDTRVTTIESDTADSVGQIVAWVQFNGQTATINGSGNVTSVTRTAAGDYTINFTSNISDVNYSATASCNYLPDSGDNNHIPYVTGRAAGSVDIEVWGIDTNGNRGSLTDSTDISVTIVR